MEAMLAGEGEATEATVGMATMGVTPAEEEGEAAAATEETVAGEEDRALRRDLLSPRPSQRPSHRPNLLPILRPILRPSLRPGLDLSHHLNLTRHTMRRKGATRAARGIVSCPTG